MTFLAFLPSASAVAPSPNGFVRPSAISESSSAPAPPGTLFLPSPLLVILSLRSFETPLPAFAPPAAPRSLDVLFPLLRLRDLITSVLSEIGRGRPFILKKSAQALQRMWVLSCERRQRGVVCERVKTSVSARLQRSHPKRLRWLAKSENRRSETDLSRAIRANRLGLLNPGSSATYTRLSSAGVTYLVVVGRQRIRQPIHRVRRSGIKRSRLSFSLSCRRRCRRRSRDSRRRSGRRRSDGRGG